MPRIIIIPLIILIAATAGLTAHAQQGGGDMYAPLKEYLPQLPPQLQKLLKGLSPSINGATPGGIDALVPAPDPLSLFAIPETPGPDEKFTVSARTPTFDKNSARYNWTVSGKKRPDLSGVGKHTITLKAGKLGDAIPVSAEITRLDGAGGTVALTVRVAEIAMPWFAATYIPRWYKGKALPIPESVVRVIAMPEIIIKGKQIPSQNLLFRWGLDNEENVREGAGLDSFSFKMGVLPETMHIVSVTAQDFERRVKKTQRVAVVAQEARANLYAVTPLGGIETRRAIADYRTGRTVLDVQIEPFFFNIKNRNDLTYDWRLAGRVVSGPAERPYLLTVDTRGADTASIPVSTTVSSEHNGIVPPSVTKSLNLRIERQ
ncbi:MAG: hypothetical protein AAB539_03185 [Patescibacteria group bacterium]